MKRLLLCPAMILLLLSPSAAAESPDILKEGERAFMRGDFAKAIEHWESAPDFYKKSNGHLNQADTLVYLRVYLSEAYRASGYDAKAAELLDSADKSASGDLKTKIAALLLLYQGDTLSNQKDEQGALGAYMESAKLSENKYPEICAKALLHAAGIHHRAGRNAETRSLLEKTIAKTRLLEQSHDKAYLLISAGELSEISEYDLFQEARKIAESIGDLRAVSHALGHIARLYEKEKRYEESLSLTRQAVFAAQQADAPESLYRWLWQSGRLLTILGDRDGAISSYRLAIQNLESIRQDMASGCQRGMCLSFRDIVGPLYFEMADILLQRSASSKDSHQIQQDLKEARSVIEQLKTVELQDYFQDECVALHSKGSSIDKLHTLHAAAIYPILLPNRTEVLVSFPDGLKQFTVSLKNDELTELIRSFRAKLEQPESRFIRYAQRLYDLLLRPLESELDSRKIDTLIFVPDGALRTIPMAALHDGRRFLIEKYAVATTPGLTLTDPKPLERQGLHMLLNGLTESVQGFSSLPNVSYELQEVHRLYESRVLRDKDFTISGVEQAFRTMPYSIVHIASHGQFDKNPKNTFLLTYNSKLTMDKLEQLIRIGKFRKDPVELLTLSACQTASGDDRAALGLAGVAVKAGARSALATLWFIDDASTSRLITDFYRKIRDSGLSKAKALQQAQIGIIKDPNLEHPAYWAPFLLIGNWM